MSNPRHQIQTSGHRYVLKRLSSYMDSQLSDRERARVQAHLHACPDCREELRTLRWTKTLAQQMPVMPVPRSFIVREADLETHHIARPRPLLVPTLARLQTAAAIVAVLLVMVVAGDLFMTRGLLMSREGALPMENAPAESDTLTLAKVPEDVQAAPPAEGSDPTPGAPEVMPMAVTTETLTVTLEIESAKVLDSPTVNTVAESSPTLPPRPTWTPTQVGQPAEETLTQSTPTQTVAAAPTLLARHTPAPTPTEFAPPTPIPTATATDTATIVPTAPPTHTPTAEWQVAQVPDTGAQEGAEGEEPGYGEEQAGPPEHRRQWGGWRITQIGLGIVLTGLLVAILWLRRWGRLG